MNLTVLVNIYSGKDLQYTLDPCSGWFTFDLFPWSHFWMFWVQSVYFWLFALEIVPTIVILHRVISIHFSELLGPYLVWKRTADGQLTGNCDFNQHYLNFETTSSSGSDSSFGSWLLPALQKALNQFKLMFFSKISLQWPTIVTHNIQTTNMDQPYPALVTFVFCILPNEYILIERRIAL